MPACLLSIAVQLNHGDPLRNLGYDKLKQKDGHGLVCEGLKHRVEQGNVNNVGVVKRRLFKVNFE